MTYWHDVFTPKSWAEFQEAGAKTSGFPDRRWKSVQNISIGDVLLCYMKGKSCWFAALEVTSKPYQDYKNRIWSDDLYASRVDARPLVTLNPGNALRAERMLQRLNIFEKVRNSSRWGVVLRGAPKKLPQKDGYDILTELKRLAIISPAGETDETLLPASVIRQDSKTEQPIQKRAAAFEGSIIRFLKDLDFQDVNGGSAFKVNGIQVDACGGHEDTLIVVECTTASKREAKSIRGKLGAFRGSIPILSKGFHRAPQYQRYAKIRYVMATSNLQIRDVDKEFAEESPRIDLWDEQFIAYYQNLYSVIGSATKYNLLGEIGIEPRTRSVIQVPAWTTTLSNSRIYLFFIEPHKLLQASYVARREMGNERYYQRILQRTRIAHIREFLRKGRSFPNSIVIAFNKPPAFTPYPEISKQYAWWPNGVGFGCLTFPANYRSCWIIDGQHRLYSFSGIHTDAKLSVAAFHKLPLEKQAQYFIEINREQKPVEADLIWDLQGAIHPSTDEGIISNVVRRLNQTGPLASRIYVPLAGRKTRNQLKFSGICLSIQNAHLTRERTVNMTATQKNPLYSVSFEQTVGRVSNAVAAFLEAVDAVFKREDKDEFLFTNVGLSTMIPLFEVVLAYRNRTPSAEDTNRYLDALQMHFEMEHPEKSDRGNLRKIGSSEAGRRMILVGFVNAIRDLTGEKGFAPRIPAHDEFGRRVTELERKMATFVFELLNIQSKEDLSTISTPNICDRVAVRYKAARDQGTVVPRLADFLTFGECREIVLDKRNLGKFEEVFVAAESGFNTTEELEGALRSLSIQRDATMHGRVVPKKYRQRELLNIYVEKLQRCMDNYQPKS
jgi:DGQHR domain-containing protein